MHITKSLPTVDSVLQLEPEELAGYLLEHFGGSASSLNPHNFGLEVDQHYKDERAKKALLEAWAWLVREGLLIATKDNWFFLSRRGLRLKCRQDLDSFRRSDILPKNSLHPVISAAVWSNFILGKYDTAVFEAFKEIEVAIRKGGGFTNADYGVDLITKAFKVENGVLADMVLPEPERKSMLVLFLGAVGLFKNPASHRHMALTDPNEAAEMISFASLLMRIVDTRVAATKAAKGP